MFSLFQERPPEDDPEGTPASRPRLQERLRAVLPAGVRFHPSRNGLIVPVAAILFFGILVFGINERRVAARLSVQNAAATAQLKETRAQIGALSAKLDSLANTQQQLAAKPAPAPPPPVARGVGKLQPNGHRQKPDPRIRRMEAQIDAQGKAIEATRQEIASARNDLQDSIAKTHEELVVLQKRGERNYFEFDLDKSKNFHSTGPVGISLRKADTKHQYADLELLVDDRKLSKKHLNLYEPVIFYPTDERQPVELVINSITKNHIRGYISSAKYKPAELATAPAGAPSTPDGKTRRRLDAQR
jgi:hypothetical protein